MNNLGLSRHKLTEFRDLLLKKGRLRGASGQGQLDITPAGTAIWDEAAVGYRMVLTKADKIKASELEKVTAETLANPGRLTAIARAGVGVDNVDLAAATAKGVLVLNTMSRPGWWPRVALMPCSLPGRRR